MEELNEVFMKNMKIDVPRIRCKTLTYQVGDILLECAEEVRH